MEKEQNTTAEKVIQKIDQDKLVPIARWHFTLRNSGFWTLWGLSIILGACATAATIFVFLNSGWTYRAVTHNSLFKFILDVIPFFWIVSLVAMIAFGYFNIRHTKRGYRFSFYLVVLLSVVISFIGGTLIYAAGIARNIDNIRRPLPFSRPIMSVKEGSWNNPEAGLLAGEVVSFDEKESVFKVKLFSGEEKNVSTVELSEENLEILEEGKKIRIIVGPVAQDSNVFIACAVLPWDTEKEIRQPMPKPLPSKNIVERKINKDRINTCEGVRPYQRYKEILITN